MGKVLDRLKSLLQWKIVTEAQIEKIANQVAEQAIQEERKWRSDDPLDFENNPHEDVFQLYQSFKPDLSKMDEKEKHIYERWVKGASFGSDGIDLSRDQPLDYLFLMQKVVKSKYYSDPHARSIINNWTFYTVGGGLKVLMPTDELQKYVNGFRVQNKMVRREKSMVKSLFQNGELFISYYVDRGSGKLDIRRIRPEEIVDIECHPEDIENIFSFHWQYSYTPAGTDTSIKVDKWVKSISYDDFIKNPGGFRKSVSDKKLEKNPEVQFIKLGDDSELRGRVPLQPVLKLLKSYENWLDDRIRLNHERAKVVWIKQVMGRSTEAKKRERRAPRGGVMLVENENVKYRIENPQLASDQAKEDGLQILYTIGAGTSLPIHILNQRSDEQAYASIRKADTPFSQFIRTHQELIGEEFEVMYRQALKVGVKFGELPEKTKIPIYTQESLQKAFHRVNEMYLRNQPKEVIIQEVKDILNQNKKEETVNTVDVPISIEFPEIIREDFKSQAEVLKIHKEMGIASRATLAARAGYNWQEEFHLMKMEVTGDGQRGDKDNFDGDEEKPEPKKEEKPEGEGDDEEE